MVYVMSKKSSFIMVLSSSLPFKSLQLKNLVILIDRLSKSYLYSNQNNSFFLSLDDYPVFVNYSINQLKKSITNNYLHSLLPSKKPPRFGKVDLLCSKKNVKYVVRPQVPSGVKAPVVIKRI